MGLPAVIRIIWYPEIIRIFPGNKGSTKNHIPDKKHITEIPIRITNTIRWRFPMVRKMCTSIDIIKLNEPEDIFPSYKKALNREDGKSTILVEFGDYHNEK